MPLKKGNSVSLPAESVTKDHPLKRKQPLSFEDRGASGSSDDRIEHGMTNDFMKNRLIRSNDLLKQTATETLLDLLKAYAGVKECSEETQTHLYMVREFQPMT